MDLFSWMFLIFYPNAHPVPDYTPPPAPIVDCQSDCIQQ